jgi:hypothetical protein
VMMLNLAFEFQVVITHINPYNSYTFNALSIKN